MIYIERTINIEDNSAYIEEPVILYKGDRNIEVQFIINNNPFKYKAGIDQTYGQLVIKRPTTDPIFSEVAKLSSNKVLFVITGDMIDELVETGNYDFQIRLLNSDLSSRATLPPVSAGFMVKEPICEESVNTAPVNYSRAVIDREIEGTFDEEGNYNKTDWSNGDIITDKKLNKIEDALYTVNDSKATKDDIPTDVSAFTNDAGYLTEHQSLEAYALKADIPSTDGLATEQYVNDAVANVDVDLTGYATEIYVNDVISNMPEEIPTVSGSKRTMTQLQSDFATEGFYYLSGFSVNCVDPFDGTSIGSISLEDGLYYGKAYTGYDGLTGSKEVVKVSLYSYTTHTSYEFEEYMDPHTNSPSGKITHFVTPSVFVNQSDLTGYATEAYVQDAVDNIELPEPDLSNYATKDEVIGTIADVTAPLPIPSPFVFSLVLPDGTYLLKNIKIPYGTRGEIFYIDEEIVCVKTSLIPITLELHFYKDSRICKFNLAGTFGNKYINLVSDSATITPPEYATKDELNTALGNIEDLLGGI